MSRKTRHPLSYGCLPKSSGLFADIGQNPAVHIKHMAVHEIGSIGSQKYRRPLQILRLAPSGRGSLGDNELIERMPAAVWLQLAQRRGLGRGNIAGPDAVALDI